MTKTPFKCKKKQNKNTLWLYDRLFLVPKLVLSANHTKISFWSSSVWCLLTDTDGDEEGNVGEHLPQNIPEVPFTAAVAVLHELSAPQNCTGTSRKVQLMFVKKMINDWDEHNGHMSSIL